MKARIKHFFGKRVPPLAKVLFYHFGLRGTLIAATRFAILLLVLLLTVVALSRAVAVAGLLLALGLQTVVFCRLGLLEFPGMVLFALGIVQENSSRVSVARKLFLGSLTLLRSRSGVYEALYRTARGKTEMQALVQLMQKKGESLTAQEAFLLARCHGECGDVGAAMSVIERAERLAPSDAAKLYLAGLCVDSGQSSKCLELVESLENVHANCEGLYLKAAALRGLARHAEALLAVNRAIQLRPCNADYQLEKGKILETLSRYRGALNQYTKAIRVHPQNPEALFRRGLLRSKVGERAGAIEDFERCHYYQNTRTEAYLLAEKLKTVGKANWIHPEQGQLTSCLTIQQKSFDVVKGDAVLLEVAVRAEETAYNCRIVALEPFGGGLEVTPRETVLERVERGRQYDFTFQVTAKRPSEVNLGQPWLLNIVLTAQESWANHLVEFQVKDAGEGRVFLVLTEDHEPAIHRERMENGGRWLIQPEEVASDLVKKSQTANELAETHALKWTHMLDAGTAVGLLLWAGSRSTRWGELDSRVQAYYRSALDKGHDCQLHLHLSGLPQSYFYCYQYDRTKDLLSFDLEKKCSHFPGWQVNSWANVVKRYGRKSDVNSRLGSLARAKNAVTTVFAMQFPAFAPIFFRAGQWDLGANTAEREKSILAIRENGILADSSVTSTYSLYEEGFGFGKPLHEAAYFTDRNNPEKRAKSLVDAGILEVVPIILPQGRHAVTPRDNAAPVVSAYHACFRRGRVTPGMHIIMEIEHLCTVQDFAGTDSDSPANNRDWKAMGRHFSDIRKQCPQLEGVGGSEAIYEWLNYYSPELLVKAEISKAFSKTVDGRSRVIVFPLKFLGEGILCETGKTYQLWVPVPLAGQAVVQKVRILEADKLVFEAEQLSDERITVSLILSKQNQDSFVLEITVRTPDQGLQTTPDELCAFVT